MDVVKEKCEQQPRSILRERVKPPGHLKITSNFFNEKHTEASASIRTTDQKRSLFRSFKSPVNSTYLVSSKHQIKSLAKAVTEIHSPSVYHKNRNYQSYRSSSRSNSQVGFEGRKRSRSKSAAAVARERVQEIVSQKLKPSLHQQYDLRWTIKKNEIKRIFRAVAMCSTLACVTKLAFNWHLLSWPTRTCVLTQLVISAMVSVLMFLREYQREVKIMIRAFVISQALLNAGNVMSSSYFGEGHFFMLSLMQMIIDPFAAILYGTEKWGLAILQGLPAIAMLFTSGPDAMHNPGFTFQVFIVILFSSLILAAFVVNEAHFYFKFAQQAAQRKKQYNQIAREKMNKDRQVLEEREITSYISHEVRNPLFNISNAIECFEVGLRDIEMELYGESQAKSFSFSSAPLHSKLSSLSQISGFSSARPSPLPDAIPGSGKITFGSFQTAVGEGQQSSDDREGSLSRSRRGSGSTGGKMSPLDTLRSIKELFAKKDAMRPINLSLRRFSGSELMHQRKLSVYTEEGDNISELHVSEPCKTDINNKREGASLIQISQNTLISPINSPPMAYKYDCLAEADSDADDSTTVSKDVTPNTTTSVKLIRTEKAAAQTPPAHTPPYLKDIYPNRHPSKQAGVLAKLKEMNENCGDVKIGVRHCLNLLNNMLDITKMEQGKLQWQVSPTSVIEVCEKALSLTRYLVPKNVEIKLDCPALVLFLDEKLLLQILVNLLSNSFKFVEKGFVLLRVKELLETFDVNDKLDIKPGVNILFEICDTGPGIPPEKQSKLFQKFVQVGEKSHFGTGLGLMVSQKMVQMKGGSIEVQSPWIDSKSGKHLTGCKFHFTLALEKQIYVPARSISLPESPKSLLTGRNESPITRSLNKRNIVMLQGLTVFICDDSKLNQKQLAHKLTKQPPFDIFSWSCTLCSSGTKAHEMIVEEGQKYDVIIVDTHLDETDEISDGLELIQKIRQHEMSTIMNSSASKKRKAIIISYSGDVSAEHRQKAIISGADISWSKPLPEPDIMLRSIIEKFCNLTSTRSSLGSKRQAFNFASFFASSKSVTRENSENICVSSENICVSSETV